MNTISSKNNNVERQIIIVGCQRSGTSALWRALRQHSLLKPLNSLPSDLPSGCEKELWFFNDFFYGRERRRDVNGKCHKNRVDSEYIERYLLNTADFIKKHFGGYGGDWIYSHPSDGLYSNYILSGLPNCKIIFLIRHPQEVVWSSLHAPWETRMSRVEFIRKARETALHWKKFATAHEKVKYGPYQDRMITIYNETLRENPAQTLRNIVEFLDISFEIEVLTELNKGAFNSSFLSETESVNKIKDSQKEIAKDGEFCELVSKCVAPYMEAHAYSSFVDLKDFNNQAPLHVSGIAYSGSYKNEEYWKNQLDWYKNEVTRRKENIPTYFAHEAFLDTYFRLYSQHARGNTPPRILEFGFGFGRHLQYLKEIETLKWFGCDISPQSLEFSKAWNSGGNTANLHLIEPRSSLPYRDGDFDVVYTVSVLIHIKPDDLRDVLTELIRICRGHIIHIENPATSWTYKTSDMHNGCWAHPLIETYKDLGCRVEILPRISHAHDIYRVEVVEKSVMPAASEVLASSLISTESIIERQNSEIYRCKSNYDQLKDHLHRLRLSRTWKLRRFLTRHRKLESSFIYLYDFLKNLKGTLFNSKYNERLLLNTKINKPNDSSIAICHPEWQGVLSAAEGQSNNLVLIPELCTQDIEGVVSQIANLSQRLFLFNGFWNNYDKLMMALRRNLPDCRILYIHHGSFYQMHEDKRQPEVVSTIVELHRKNVIDRIGFVKMGMAESLKLLGCPAWYVMNYVCPEPEPLIKRWQRPIRIAIPVRDKLRKNPDTQIVAALLLPDIDEIHLWHNPDIQYLRSMGADLDKLVIHQGMSREETRALLNTMMFTMYVTISECFPMILLESMAAATPCFTSNTHGVLKDFPDLSDKLIISEADNPVAIAEHIEKQIPDIENLSRRSLEVYSSISEMAKKSISDFTAFDT